MIDVHENVVPLARAPGLVPGRPHISTFWRWAGRGVRGHRLEILRIGGKVYTSQEAIDRFLAALNSAPDSVTSPTAAAELAGAALDRLGI
jgi:hypothetical protein